MQIGHEILSTAILSLPLIQVGQLSVTVERICLSTGEPLRSKPAQKSVVMLNDHLDMTIIVDWDVKQHSNK